MNNKKTHSCCEFLNNESSKICKICGKSGLPVSEVTVKNIVKDEILIKLKNFSGFYFCKTPTCDVVYFNNEENIYLYKSDVKVRVGIKEKEEPIPVCYCFGWTKEKILNEIKETGVSSAIQEISKKIKVHECSCETKNPSGRCCLNEVKEIVKTYLEIFGKS